MALMMMSSTAAFACPPGVLQKTLTKMHAKGRHTQPSEVDCHGNGTAKGGHGTMVIAVGGELVGSCSVDRTVGDGPPKRYCHWLP